MTRPDDARTSVDALGSGPVVDRERGPGRGQTPSEHGDDGSAPVGIVLGRGDEVDGIGGRTSAFDSSRFDHLNVAPNSPCVQVFSHYGDLSDGGRPATSPADLESVDADVEVLECAGRPTPLSAARCLRAA